MPQPISRSDATGAAIFHARMQLCVAGRQSADHGLLHARLAGEVLDFGEQLVFHANSYFGICQLCQLPNAKWTRPRVPKMVPSMTEDTFSIRLARVIADRGLSKQAAADLCGVKYHALNAVLIRENALPNAQIAHQIATGLGVSLDWLLTGKERAAAPVAVVGRVGAGASVPLVDAFEKGDGLYHVARPPQLPNNGVVAVEVEGDSMAPMYQPGHVLFFRRVADDAVLDTDIGKPCVIEDAEHHAWVKLLKRGSAPGLWNLISLNPSAESAWDVSILWAARVLMALPGDLIEKVEEA